MMSEELSHNIAVNTEPHWNAEISKLQKKINFTEEKNIVLQKKTSKTLGTVLLSTKFHL